MHVKYIQDNLYHMTWYTGHGFIIHVSFMVECGCDHNATISNGTVTIGWTLLVGVDHSRSDSIMLLMLRTVCCAMARALTLYDRPLEIALTLLRMDNILGRLYC